MTSVFSCRCFYTSPGEQGETGLTCCDPFSRPFRDSSVCSEQKHLLSDISLLPTCPHPLPLLMCQGVRHGPRGLHRFQAQGGEHELEQLGHPVLMEDAGWALLQSGDQETEAMPQMHSEGGRDQGKVQPGPCAQCHVKEDLSGSWVQKSRETGRNEAGCQD